MHWNHFFPALLEVDRSTFVRQAANLWAVKERIWCLIRDSFLPYDPSTAIIDSFPLPVCQFARAPRCSRFKGFDHTIRQTFSGFRVHARVAWPGLITHLYLAPALWVEPKRRGRPRKATGGDPTEPKRPRGRPRKLA